MGKIGFGYGSEWHLLWHLARHRTSLDDTVRRVTGADHVEWLDFPLRCNDGPSDAEWTGLDFLTDADTQAAWRSFWPQGAGIQNWDAVARIKIEGRPEWLLVEAKAHCGEIESTCGAKPEGALAQIRAALEATKTYLGVEPDRDWLRGYYQFCNRLAVLQFLESRRVPAHLLMIYFTGDVNGDRSCPKDALGWQAAIAAQDAHVGLPKGHALEARIHKVFLLAFTNVRNPLSRRS